MGAVASTHTGGAHEPCVSVTNTCMSVNAKMSPETVAVANEAAPTDTADAASELPYPGCRNSVVTEGSISNDADSTSGSQSGAVTWTTTVSVASGSYEGAGGKAKVSTRPLMRARLAIHSSRAGSPLPSSSRGITAARNPSISSLAAVVSAVTPNGRRVPFGSNTMLSGVRRSDHAGASISTSSTTARPRRTSSARSGDVGRVTRETAFGPQRVCCSDAVAVMFSVNDALNDADVDGVPFVNVSACVLVGACVTVADAAETVREAVGCVRVAVPAETVWLVDGVLPLRVSVHVSEKVARSDRVTVGGIVMEVSVSVRACV
jgi:hypothetical protein